MRSESRPPVDQPKRIGIAWPQASLIVVREKFRFIGRHIHIHRTVSLTALARKAEIKCVFHTIITPSTNGITLQHLKEQMSASTCAMFLLARDHKTGTHRSLLGAAAAPDANTAQSSPGKTAQVVLIMEACMQLRRVIRCS